jgi:hypothetical protein
MNEIVFGAQVSNEFRRPSISSGLPSENPVVTVDLTEERSEVANIFVPRQKRFWALEQNHVRVHDGGYVSGELPRQPDLFRATKAAVEIFFLTAYA